MPKQKDDSIPIIDLFAGPGGLGEGFSAFQTPDGRQPFKISLSIEKEPCAHQTLTLRSFFRQFAPGNVPQEYYDDYLRRVAEPEPVRRKRLFDAWPEEAERAEKTALLSELGVNDPQTIRAQIWKALEGYDEFVLLGGPPCQAYSVMGRSNNSGNPLFSRGGAYGW
jgi:DNA (cytosine-5)-methyltransferase 1